MSACGVSACVCGVRVCVCVFRPAFGLVDVQSSIAPLLIFLFLFRDLLSLQSPLFHVFFPLAAAVAATAPSLRCASVGASDADSTGVAFAPARPAALLEWRSVCGSSVAQVRSTRRACTNAGWSDDQGHTHRHRHTHTETQTHRHRHRDTDTHTHTHTHIHIYTHTHAHTHTEPNQSWQP